MPYRVIPCDFGHQINVKIFKNILNYLERSSEWTILSKSENVDRNELLSAKLKSKEANLALYLHIYSDGIGIFTLIERGEKYDDFKEYYPENTLSVRASVHKDLLMHNHTLSNIMDKYVTGIRSFFNKDLARISSYSTWENKGLSYVMSFYFIDADVELIEEADFQDKLIFLLFPLHDENREVDYSKGMDPSLIKKKFREKFLSVVKKDYEILPYIHTCASWSNFLIIGRITDKREEYWKLERDLQHVWFYSYITDEFIEQSLKNISTKTPESELEVLDNILTEMTFKITQYEGIVSSTMHEREFRLYEALRTTSRLDMLIANVEKKANLLKDRYNWLLQEKRTKADKRIEFILFIIAIISVIGAYKSFQELGVYPILLIVFFALLFSVYFFKPFFHW